MKKKIILTCTLVGVLLIGGITAFASEVVRDKVDSTLFREEGDEIVYSNDYGINWNEYVNGNKTDFYTIEEYIEWSNEQKKYVDILQDAGELTPEQAEEMKNNYDNILNDVENGVFQVGIRSNTEQDQVLFSMPEGMHTTGYQTVVYDGENHYNFGPYDTVEELYEELAKHLQEQVNLGKLSEKDAQELLESYK